MRIYNNPLTSQNSRPIGMLPSGVMFNLVSSLTNDWTPLPSLGNCVNYNSIDWVRTYGNLQFTALCPDFN